jgi:hypothetical protein
LIKIRDMGRSSGVKGERGSNPEWNDDAAVVSNGVIRYEVLRDKEVCQLQEITALVADDETRSGPDGPDRARFLVLPFPVPRRGVLDGLVEACPGEEGGGLPRQRTRRGMIVAERSVIVVGARSWARSGGEKMSPRGMGSKCDERIGADDSG